MIPLEPMVPFLIENVSIPAGFSISDIRVVANSSIELPGTYNLSIAPEDEAMEGILKTLDSRAWSGKYPDKLFDFVTMPQRDGSMNVFLTVFPFQWDADTGKVVYYSNITLDVDIKDTWVDSVSLRTTKSVSFKKIGRGSNFLIQLQISNNGSNTIYNLEFEEFILILRAQLTIRWVVHDFCNRKGLKRPRNMKHGSVQCAPRGAAQGPCFDKGRIMQRKGPCVGGGVRRNARVRAIRRVIDVA